MTTGIDSVSSFGGNQDSFSVAAAPTAPTPKKDFSIFSPNVSTDAGAFMASNNSIWTQC